MMSLRELKERKLFQWALAYVAGAWALLQVADLLSETYAWPPLLMRVLPVLLAVGFFAALVFAWYHGEKGRQRVSTVELGMLTGILLVGGAAVAWVGASTATGVAEPAPVSAASNAEALVSDGAAEQGSIAVLPFVNMSADADNEYFSDGITEELLNVLAQLPELRVVARTSAFAFKGQNVGIDSVARALNVRHVLEGSVRKADQQVRITAQLIDASTGYHMWSETYDRELEDLFAVQDEIARAIVDQLQIELSDEAGRLATTETTDAEAHALVLRAKQMIANGGGDPETLFPRAERLFEQAIERDSSYATAWAGVANIHRLQAQMGLIPQEEGMERARAEGRRALALDPDEGDAHLVLGAVAWLDGDFQAVGEHYQRALRSKPGDPRTLAFYSDWAAAEGRMEEALRAARRGVEIDPLSVPALNAAARRHLVALDLEGSAQLYRRALDLAPDNPYIMSDFGFAQILRGEREEALELADRVLELAPTSHWDVARAGWIYAYARDFGRAVETFRMAVELAPDQPLRRAELANALVMTGGAEEALEHVERAVELADTEEEAAAVQVIRGFVHAKAGRRSVAERALEEIPEDDHLGRAAVHASLGQADRAFTLLERALETKEHAVVELGADWWFDDLRGDPRMDRLLARVGVPEVATGW